MLNKNSPIGIFDSGIGGLTVLKAIRSLMPHEDIIYFGDTARVPYGSKSKQIVIKYSEEILTFLLSQHVKCIVVACNTASSYAMESLKNKTKTPIMGVIEPGVDALIQKIGNSHVAALVATNGTIKSKTYELILREKRKDITLKSKACPLFVPLVEENLVDHKITKETIRFYLHDFHEAKINHIILGCTHYPHLKNTIARVYPNFKLIDSSQEASITLKIKLKRQNLLTDQSKKGKIKIYVSDSIENFDKNKDFFLGEESYSLEGEIFNCVASVDTA